LFALSNSLRKERVENKIKISIKNGQTFAPDEDDGA
jgi:hypothetical protein